MRPPALFTAFPSLRESTPFHALGSFPTRVHRLDRVPGITRSVEVWAKRDDESHPRYGGNKVRKLEFILGAALADGKRRLVTLGACGSHHVLATTVHGRAAGFDVEAVVFPQPLTPHVEETMRAGEALGCRFHHVPSPLVAAPLLSLLALRGGTARIEPGGSSPLGCLGYVSAGLEIAAQIEAGECPAFDEIYVALGSCGTAAGLLVGLGAAGLSTRVVAVRVVDAIVCNRQRTIDLARRTARLIEVRAGVRLRLDEAALSVEEHFFAGGYGCATDETRRAVTAAAAGGLVLETTYTGKAFAALLAEAASGRLDGRRVLFVDTFSSAEPGTLKEK